MDSIDSHVVLLGKIVSNLQSLEFCLRAALCNADPLCKGNTESLHNLKKGQVVSSNPLTNYDNLDELIEKFNKLIMAQEKNCTIEKEKVVDLRDAVAHGRVSSSTYNGELEIIKFSKHYNGDKTRVEVTYAETMTKEWMRERGNFLVKEVKKVHLVLDQLL